MPDINEVVKNVVKKNWDRSFRVIVGNIFGIKPTIRFDVEAAQLLDGKDFTSKPIGHVSTIYNESASYPLLSPIDDSVIPDEALITLSRHAQIQVCLYSLFKHLLTYMKVSK